MFGIQSCRFADALEILGLEQPHVTGPAGDEIFDQKLKLGKYQNNKSMNVVLGNFMGEMNSLRAFRVRALGITDEFCSTHQFDPNLSSNLVRDEVFVLGIPLF